jgi:hypothetical protein
MWHQCNTPAGSWSATSRTTDSLRGGLGWLKEKIAEFLLHFVGLSDLGLQ